MQAQTFSILANVVKERSGLALTPDKAYLFDTRLMAVARRWSLDSVDALANRIYAQPNDLQINDVVQAMTTNESLFFRDTKPFTLFVETMLPALKKVRAARRHIRIWSAASSAGQEAYSLAMLIKDHEAEFQGWTFEIVGTDLCQQMVDHAKTGLYSQFEIHRGLPDSMLHKYFAQAGDHWQISQQIRNMVRFQTGNLLHSLSSLGQFDIVFCRNVLIYFDVATKGKVLDAVARQMPDDGYLVLGGAETVLGVSKSFMPMPDHPGLYAKRRFDAGKAAVH